MVSLLALCLNLMQNYKFFLVQAKIHNIPSKLWAVTIVAGYMTVGKAGS